MRETTLWISFWYLVAAVLSYNSVTFSETALAFAGVVALPADDELDTDANTASPRERAPIPASVRGQDLTEILPFAKHPFHCSTNRDVWRVSVSAIRQDQA